MTTQNNEVFLKAESFLKVCYQELEMTEKLQDSHSNFSFKKFSNSDAFDFALQHNLFVL